MDIVALGEILIDFTPSGVNEQGIALFARNPGGAPANVLAMNAKLGGSSAFMGKVGNDAFGAYLKGVLRSHGIDTRGMVTDEEIPTTLAFVQLDELGDRSFTFYRKPGADLRLEEAELRKDLIDTCKLFHFGSLSLTDEPCRSATLEAVRYARAQGKLISFDPNYRPGLWQDQETAKRWMAQGVKYADILKVSEEEMALLTGEADPEIGSLGLLELGPKAVFVTMGAHGCYYRNAACHGSAPAYKVTAVDTTGAGDAFMGAMLWQLRNCSRAEIGTLDLKSHAAFANAAGSLTTTRSGAIPALPTYEEILSYTQASLHKGYFSENR